MYQDLSIYRSIDRSIDRTSLKRAFQDVTPRFEEEKEVEEKAKEKDKDTRRKEDPEKVLRRELFPSMLCCKKKGQAVKVSIGVSLLLALIENHPKASSEASLYE
ncbi:hypothetical protein HZH68_010215 [Vespula germanica]|uniref:Uncharacterized protein n=1 Tax=Vespula germanica TaxID=30212 RepID=A0A834JS06_VESGE|nr:hypothetical protein HZH68_010215 [Vespula germanica]